MKTIVNTLGSLLLSMVVWNQIHGQIKTDSYINAVTLDTVKMTEWVTVSKSAGGAATFRLSRINSQRSIELRFCFGSMSPFNVSTKDSLWLVDQDGNVFSFPCLTNDFSRTGAGPAVNSFLGMEMPGIEARYLVSKGQAVLMESKLIRMIRVSSSRGIDEYEVAAGNENLFGEAFRCLYASRQKTNLRLPAEKDQQAGFPKPPGFTPGKQIPGNSEDLAYSALRFLKKANVFNYISIGNGMASNLEMVILGGFPLEYDGGVNPAANITHLMFCTFRLTSSLFTPVCVAKARKTLKSWAQSPDHAGTSKKLFAYLDAAEILSALAPVLCGAGGAMMLVASTSTRTDFSFPYERHETVTNPGLKTAGWLFVGAGLVASLGSAVCIELAKKELQERMGSVQLKAGSEGIGVIYRLPEGRSSPKNWHPSAPTRE